MVGSDEEGAVRRRQAAGAFESVEPVLADAGRGEAYPVRGRGGGERGGVPGGELAGPLSGVAGERLEVVEGEGGAGRRHGGEGRRGWLGFPARGFRRLGRGWGEEVSDAAQGALRLALLSDDGPTAGFFSWDGTHVPW
jgi:hypothetical protein